MRSAAPRPAGKERDVVDPAALPVFQWVTTRGGAGWCAAPPSGSQSAAMPRSAQIRSTSDRSPVPNASAQDMPKCGRNVRSSCQPEVANRSVSAGGSAASTRRVSASSSRRRPGRLHAASRRRAGSSGRYEPSWCRHCSRSAGPPAASHAVPQGRRARRLDRCDRPPARASRTAASVGGVRRPRPVRCSTPCRPAPRPGRSGRSRQPGRPDRAP